MMDNTPELILALLIVVCGLAMLARRFGVAMPIVLVLGGIVLGFVPQMPQLSIPPDWMLLIFLPPLLMEAAYFTSLRDFRANLLPILQLAIGLVVVTAVAVATALHGLDPRMSLAVGLVLGAILSPPDAVAATAIIRTLRVPKRVVSILEGESLVNDAAGLVLFAFAVTAVVSGGISLPQGVLDFLWMVGSGIAIGFLGGTLFMRVFPYIRETSVEILASLLLPYAVYLLADLLNSSGVIAVVIAGLAISWRAPEVFTARYRIQSEAVWRMLTFLLQGILFLLIGLQFPSLLRGFGGQEIVWLLFVALVIGAVTALVRFVWVYSTAYVQYLLRSRRHRHDPAPAWQNVFLIAWTGMRGVVSLATALAIPLTLADGTPFPYRDEIIFLSVVVIIFTLVVQGLTLPWLIQRMTLSYNADLLLEEWIARATAAREALRVIGKLREELGPRAPALERIAGHYQDRLASLGDGPNTPLTPSENPDGTTHPLILAEKKIWSEVLAAERQAVLDLRRTFRISDDVMHEILRELDLLSSRFA